MFSSTSSSTFGCWDLLNSRRNFRRVGLKGQHLMNTDKRSRLSQTLLMQAASCFVTVTSAIPSTSHWVFFFPSTSLLSRLSLCAQPGSTEKVGTEKRPGLSSLGAYRRGEQDPAWQCSPLWSTKAAESQCWNPKRCQLLNSSSFDDCAC